MVKWYSMGEASPPPLPEPLYFDLGFLLCPSQSWVETTSFYIEFKLLDINSDPGGNLIKLFWVNSQVFEWGYAEGLWVVLHTFSKLGCFTSVNIFLKFFEIVKLTKNVRFIHFFKQLYKVVINSLTQQLCGYVAIPIIIRQSWMWLSVPNTLA